MLEILLNIIFDKQLTTGERPGYWIHIEPNLRRIGCKLGLSFFCIREEGENDNGRERFL